MQRCLIAPQTPHLHASPAWARHKPLAGVGIQAVAQEPQKTPVLVPPIPSTVLISPDLAATREKGKNGHQTSLTKPFILPARQAGFSLLVIRFVFFCHVFWGEQFARVV